MANQTADNTIQQQIESALLETKTLADIPAIHADLQPEKPALTCGTRTLSYAQFAQSANRFANAFQQIGLAPADRVAHLDLNSDYFFTLFFGCAQSNTVMTGINWRLAAPEIEYILNDSQAKVLFIGEPFFPLVESILPKLTHLKTIITLSGNHRQWQSIEQWQTQFESKRPDIRIQPDDIVIQLYTSGTTGHPKGVELSHQVFFAFIQPLYDLRDNAELNWTQWYADDISLIAMPCFHIGGAGWGTLGLISGATNIVLKEFNPPDILSMITQHRINKLFLVPAAIQFILQLPQAATTDFSSLDYLIYGASPIPLPLLQQAIEVFQCEFVQVYGMTETTGTATHLPPQDHSVSGNQRMQSAGKPMPGVEIKIIDQQQRPVAIGSIGEIAIRSPANMHGYWRLPEATAQTLVDGWILTGDAGYQDQDGYLYIQDRVKDMIVSGGENIYPAEIESILYGHPDILEVAIIGVPDERWGEAVKAIVVLKPGHWADAESILAFCEDKIARYKRPKSVEFLTALPRNSSGKILKKDLRQKYWQGRTRAVN